MMDTNIAFWHNSAVGDFPNEVIIHVLIVLIYNHLNVSFKP